jgi:hypothetical protein
MSIKNVYEVLDDFRNATTKQDRLDILRRNDSYALRNILLGALNPEIKFTIKKVPEYRKVDIPQGLSYSHMTEALSKVYLWVDGNPKRPKGLTENRATELLLQLLESLEPKEAEVFAAMIRKDLKIPHLTQKLVNEAFPGLLPE